MGLQVCGTCTRSTYHTQPCGDCGICDDCFHEALANATRTKAGYERVKCILDYINEGKPPPVVCSVICAEEILLPALKSYIATPLAPQVGVLIEVIEQQISEGAK